jgi:glycosyltransferase involved in cell wall biosynthesis
MDAEVQMIEPGPPRIGPAPQTGPRPFWSVMIPAYNRTQYLEKTLRSVLAQDPGPEEMQIEVVDDASSVEDPEPLVRRVAGDRVSFFRNPRNLGLMPNFNNCIERARGHWVHILHTDDLVFPGFYEPLRHPLEARSDIGAAVCRYAFMDENGVNPGTSELLRPTPGILADFLEDIAISCCLRFPAVVVRRSVYEELGGFRLDLPFSADWEMWVRIAAHYPVWFEPATMAAFRMHSTSATTGFTRSGEAFMDMHRCVEISRRWLPPHRAEILSRRAKEHVYLCELSVTSEDNSVLALVEKLVKVSGRNPECRSAVSNASLRAARIHYRQGRRFQALADLVRAVLLRPIVAGRPAKRAVSSLLDATHELTPEGEIRKVRFRKLRFNAKKFLHDILGTSFEPH